MCTLELHELLKAQYTQQLLKMSLFKTRELWSVTNPPNENYNSRSLALYPSEVRNFIDQLTRLSYL